jgi:hypothetical protein
MVIFTGLTPIAERPTGAGLTLGMGLRAMRRSRTDDSAEAVEAEQDGLGGVVSNLTDEEGIYRRAGIFLRGGVVGRFVQRVSGCHHKPPISFLATNQRAQT